MKHIIENERPDCPAIIAVHHSNASFSCLTFFFFSTVNLTSSSTRTLLRTYTMPHSQDDEPVEIVEGQEHAVVLSTVPRTSK